MLEAATTPSGVRLRYLHKTSLEASWGACTVWVLSDKLDPQVRAVLLAMVSRIPDGGILQRYLELLNQAGDGVEDALCDAARLPEKARTFLKKWVTDYKHGSISELTGVPAIVVENISCPFARLLMDDPLFVGIEASTRAVAHLGTSRAWDLGPVPEPLPLGGSYRARALLRDEAKERASAYAKWEYAKSAWSTALQDAGIRSSIGAGPSGFKEFLDRSRHLMPSDFGTTVGMCYNPRVGFRHLTKMHALFALSLGRSHELFGRCIVDEMVPTMRYILSASDQSPARMAWADATSRAYDSNGGGVGRTEDLLKLAIACLGDDQEDGSSAVLRYSYRLYMLDRQCTVATLRLKLVAALIDVFQEVCQGLVPPRAARDPAGFDHLFHVAQELPYGVSTEDACVRGSDLQMHTVEVEPPDRFYGDVPSGPDRGSVRARTSRNPSGPGAAVRQMRAEITQVDIPSGTRAEFLGRGYGSASVEQQTWVRGYIYTSIAEWRDFARHRPVRFVASLVQVGHKQDPLLDPMYTHPPAGVRDPHTLAHYDRIRRMYGTDLQRFGYQHALHVPVDVRGGAPYATYDAWPASLAWMHQLPLGTLVRLDFSGRLSDVKYMCELRACSPSGHFAYRSIAQMLLCDLHWKYHMAVLDAVRSARTASGVENTRVSRTKFRSHAWLNTARHLRGLYPELCTQSINPFPELPVYLW